MAKWTIPEKTSHIDEAIATLKQLSDEEHLASDHGFSGIGYWIQLASEFLETQKRKAEAQKPKLQICRNKVHQCVAIKWTGDNTEDVRLICEAHVQHSNCGTRTLKVSDYTHEWNTVQINQMIVKQDGQLKVMDEQKFIYDYE